MPAREPGVGVDQISLAVVVPKRARVNQAFASLQQMRLGPFAGGIIGGDNVNAFVRHREKNPEFPGVKPDGRRPDAATGLDFGVARIREIFDGMGDDASSSPNPLSAESANPACS